MSDKLKNEEGKVVRLVLELKSGQAWHRCLEKLCVGHPERGPSTSDKYIISLSDN